MSDKAKVDVVIERDIWVKNEKTKEVDRIRKGQIVSVDLDEKILDGIASGAIRRATPEDIAARDKAKEKA